MSIQQIVFHGVLLLCLTSGGACAGEEADPVAPEESGICSAAAQSSTESAGDSSPGEALSAVPTDYDWMGEIETNFTTIRAGARTYYDASAAGACQFPASTPGGDEHPPQLTPVEGTCCSAGGLGGPDTNGDNLCEVTGGMNMFCSEETWIALGFAPETPHAFTYRFFNRDDWNSTPSDNHDAFTVEAFGDPECDGVPVIYSQTVDIASYVEPDWSDVEYDDYGDPVPAEPAPCALVGEGDEDLWTVSTSDLRLGSVPSGYDLNGEVETNFAKILSGAITAYESSAPGACQFPANQGLTPLEETCCSAGGLGGPDSNANNLCESGADWEYGTWSEIGFEGPEEEFAMVYGFGSSEATFEVYAKADPSCQADPWHYTQRIDLSTLTFEGDGCVPVGGAEAWSAAISETANEPPTVEMAQ